MMGSEQQAGLARDSILSVRDKILRDAEQGRKGFEPKLNLTKAELSSGLDAMRHIFGRVENAANRHRDQTSAAASKFMKDAYYELQQEFLTSTDRVPDIDGSLRALTVAKQGLEASQLKKEWIKGQRKEVEERTPVITSLKRGKKTTLSEAPEIKGGAELAKRFAAEVTKFEDVIGLVVLRRLLAPEAPGADEEPTYEVTIEFQNVVEARPSLTGSCTLHECSGTYEVVSLKPPGFDGIGQLVAKLNADGNKPEFVVRLRVEFAKLLEARRSLLT